MNLEQMLATTPEAAARATAAYLRGFDPNRVALYGAGNIGRTVLGLLRERGIEPRVVYDDTPAKQGTSFHGVPIRNSSERDPTLTVVVSILNPKHHFPSTARRLGGHVLPFLALPWCFPDLTLLHMLAPERLLQHADEIRRFDRLLEDDVSRRTLSAQIAFRMSLDTAHLEPTGEPYFPPDVPLALGAGVGYLDAGAYDGDTIRSFLSHVREPGEIVAAEADPRSFQKLEAWAAGRPEKIRCCNVAVGAQSGVLRFNATGDMSASLDAHGEIEVPVRGLEALWPDADQTYLKFDIEGAEADALFAAESLLRARRPKLAVSVYHHATDLWKIPLFLADCGYRLWLRDHGIEGTDVVAYAIPR